MPTLISNGFLNLVCVDELHLFGIFRITFRKYFVLMKKSFFYHLIDDMLIYHQAPLELTYILKVSLQLSETATPNKKIEIGVKPENLYME